MKQDIDKIIEMLERAQDLIEKGKASEAVTQVYDAQILAIFLRDNLNQ